MGKKTYSYPKYWDDPLDYLKQRFSGRSGRIIDDVEKEAVLDLLITYSKKTNFARMKILDLATGTGRLSLYLKKNLKTPKVVGLDINSNMLNYAKNEAEKRKISVSFIKGDIYNLPFKNKTFDAIVGLRFFMHLEDEDAIFREAGKVIKEGGLFIFDIFNQRSILKLRSGLRVANSIDELESLASSYGFRLLDFRGLFLLGETVTRKLNLFSVSPNFVSKFSTKLVLCYEKLFIA